jgi:glycerol-3-phosphate acyltransferase PlsX
LSDRRPVRIALDAMGTDQAPASEVAGAVLALKELGEDLEVVLVGDRGVIQAELARHDGIPDARLHIRHAPDRVLSGDAPSAVVRKRPESSIVVGLKMQKDGAADAFVSAGSTGAVMAASLFILRPLEGVDRPTVGTVLPTAGTPVLLVDAGANVDCKPHHLLQFAHLGHVYAQDMMGIESPRVALLNVGEEPEKGDELALETHRLLARSELNFVGNVEGRDLIAGTSDVIVCDGFVGNVLLKFYESVAAYIVKMLRREFAKFAKAGQSLDLDEVLRVLDYSETGGAPLLGVNGVSVICHGESTPKAVLNAIRAASQAVRASMVEHMAKELSVVLGGMEEA